MGMYIGLGVGIILVIFGVIEYNHLIQLGNRVNEAFSTMDVYLKKRWELIPNLVDTVKGYTKHESVTFEDLTQLRGQNYDQLTHQDKLDINEQITQIMNQVIALAENYPDLKASTNFIDLSKQLVQIEDDIANSRKYYNGTVRIYNNKVE